MEEMVFGRRYRATEKIGTGGMADVYKAVDEVLGRTVAVKVLNPKYASDPTFAQRFRQEAQAAGNLVSPYIVNMYDWGQEGDTYYIVMEYVRGNDLKSLIVDRGAMDPAKVADIGAQVCAALSVAHGYDIIHRDIKPHNIMVLPDGTVKVMDFGIARAGNSNMTQTGSVLGTAHYVSPEQAQGKPLTAASDLYSLGIVLYEASTGRVPFDADTPVAVALKQVNDEARPPRTINPNIPAALEAVIEKAMAKDPHARYGSANEMRSDLQQVAQGGVPAVAAAGLAAGGPGVPASETAVMPAVGGPAASAAHRSAPRRNKNTVWPWVLVALLLIAGGLGAAYALGFIGFGVTVPSVTGISATSAKSQLEAAGLTVGEVTEAFDDNVTKGMVIEQTPVAGTKVDKGSAVALVVSKGVETVIVPDVTGLPETEAFKTLKEFGLDPQPGTPEFSKDVEQGMVIKQDPVAGEEITKGSSVTYVVSKGKELAQVPDVVGKSQAAASDALKAAGLKVSVKTAYSDSVAKGKVISQNPGGGVSVAKGSTVTIVVSQGTLTVKVPDVVGMTEAAAKSKLAEFGLKATVTYSPGSTPDKVLEQTPLPGQDAKRGDTVEILVGQAGP